MPMSSTSVAAPAPGASPAAEAGLHGAHAQIALHRPFLVRVARRRLRNEAWADDAVSETVLAALERPKAWAGRALVRTWLVGILKHKLVDQVRRHARECPFSDAADADASEDRTDAMVDSEIPAGWGDPLESLGRLQLRQQLNRCLTTLPPQQARALVMNDWVGEDTKVICNELGVTSNNLGVMLHRARRSMRTSLQTCGVSGPRIS